MTAGVDGLVVEHRDGATWLTIDRPEAANALTPAVRDGLIAALEAAGDDPTVRVVVIAATGKHFCSGADLSGTAPDPEAPAPGPGSIARMLRQGSQRLIAAVLDCDKPVVAEIHGAAAGIGAHLALACDFVIAADDARIIEVFARRALVPDGGGAYLLPRLVGPQVAKRLMMLADDLPATEAQTLGLVHAVAPLADLRAQTQALVDRLAVAPTRTLALTKWLVNRSLESSRDQCFADEALAQEHNMSTADAAEGLASFAERRPATYTGR